MRVILSLIVIALAIASYYYYVSSSNIPRNAIKLPIDSANFIEHKPSKIVVVIDTEHDFEDYKQVLIELVTRSIGIEVAIFSTGNSAAINEVATQNTIEKVKKLTQTPVNDKIVTIEKAKDSVLTMTKACQFIVLGAFENKGADVSLFNSKIQQIFTLLQKNAFIKLINVSKRNNSAKHIQNHMPVLHGSSADAMCQSLFSILFTKYDLVIIPYVLPAPSVSSPLELYLVIENQTPNAILPSGTILRIPETNHFFQIVEQTPNSLAFKQKLVMRMTLQPKADATYKTLPEKVALEIIDINGSKLTTFIYLRTDIFISSLQQTISEIKLAGHSPQLLLLGPPGSGKSTFIYVLGNALNTRSFSRIDFVRTCSGVQHCTEAFTRVNFTIQNLDVDLAIDDTIGITSDSNSYTRTFLTYLLEGRVLDGEERVNDTVKFRPSTRPSLAVLFIVRFDLCSTATDKKHDGMCDKIKETIDLTRKYGFNPLLVITHLELKNVEKRQEYITALVNKFNIAHGQHFEFYFDSVATREKRKFTEDVNAIAIVTEALQQSQVKIRQAILNK